MYRCDSCQAVSPPGARRHTVVVKRREHHHPYRMAAHRFRVEGKVVVKDDPGGVGSQIVKELGVCQACRRMWEEEL